MVHIYCSNEKCRRVIHLDDHTHWNFKGEVKCQKCGELMELEVKDGELKRVRVVEKKEE